MIVILRDLAQDLHGGEPGLGDGSVQRFYLVATFVGWHLPKYFLPFFSIYLAGNSKR
jgi:hypothetical protein